MSDGLLEQVRPPYGLSDRFLAEAGAEEGRELLRSFCDCWVQAGAYLREGFGPLCRTGGPLPRPEWDAEALGRLEQAFGQMRDWRGLCAAGPLEGFDLSDLYRVAEVLQFRLEDFATRPGSCASVIGVTRWRHRLEESPLRLFYRLPGGSVRPSAFTRLFGRPAGHLPAAAPGQEETFGYTPENPVRCGSPEGACAYLRQLRCPNGHPFQAVPLGVGTAEGVAGYRLECAEGEHTCKLHIDLSHPNPAAQPTPRGLGRVGG